VHQEGSAGSDNEGVDHYNVYGSMTPGFTPGPTTLVGQPTGTAFNHSVGLRQRWYCQVSAVDGAGNEGAPSAPATAVSGDTVRYEAESLLTAVSSTAPAISQGNCCGVNWSGGAQLWCMAQKAGDQVTVALSVPSTGSYDLAAAQTKARDYGINTLAVDGKTMGAPFDAYKLVG